MHRSSVLKLYMDVIEDVISGVRDLFAEDGVDDQVLQELKQTWESKLMTSKAVDNQNDIEKQTEKKMNELANNMPKQQVILPPVQQPVAQVVETKMVPIQITLPAQPGTNIGQRVLTIQVPASALQENQLQKILTGPVITATMNLPEHIASSVLQQHVNATFTQQVVNIGSIVNKVQQNDGCADSDTESENVEMTGEPSKLEPFPGHFSSIQHPSAAVEFSVQASSSSLRKQEDDLLMAKLKMLDGPLDTSDEDNSDEDDVSDEADDDKDEEDPEMEAEGPEEEPLNSEDDVTDEEPTEVFDTENVVVCQYEKITRSRNKWKFHLKDGIMNLNGEDYLFQKAVGDAEW